MHQRARESTWLGCDYLFYSLQSPHCHCGPLFPLWGRFPLDVWNIFPQVLYRFCWIDWVMKVHQQARENPWQRYDCLFYSLQSPQGHCGPLFPLWGRIPSDLWNIVSKPYFPCFRRRFAKRIRNPCKQIRKDIQMALPATLQAGCVWAQLYNLMPFQCCSTPVLF